MVKLNNLDYGDKIVMTLFFIFMVISILVLCFVADYQENQIEELRKERNMLEIHSNWVCTDYEYKYSLVLDHTYLKHDNFFDVEKYCDDLYCETEEMASKFLNTTNPDWENCRKKCRDVSHQDILDILSDKAVPVVNKICTGETLQSNGRVKNVYYEVFIE